MPPKRKTPAPIDRPLSKAYLRQFTGWSTAYPPGQSEPTSLRLMENILVDRNGALQVRPGLQYLSYMTSPDISPEVDNSPGIAIDRPMIGTQEPFYVTGGDTPIKALLFAVREDSGDPTVLGPVGWRALLFSGTSTVVHRLTDPEIGFEIPQGEAVLNFSSATTHVEYLQIDNKIVALSDAGEEMRLFYVGAEKLAKRLGSISMPQWEDTHKLRVVHPDQAWIAQQGVTVRRNEIYNSSFEAGGEFWTKSARCAWTTSTNTPYAGTKRLQLSSAPARTNMIKAPLHRVSTYGIAGWYSDKDAGSPRLSVASTYMRITDASGGARFFKAYGHTMTTGVAAGTKYRLALDFGQGSHVDPFVQIEFTSASGAAIGSRKTFYITGASGRFESPAFTTPAGTTGMRMYLGGKNTTTSSTYVQYKNITVCKDGESTASFDGDSGGGAAANYFWTGDPHKSASVYHPPVDITLASNRYPVKAGQPFFGSIYMTSQKSKVWAFKVRAYDKDAKEIFNYPAGGTLPIGGWTRASAGTANASAATVTADIQLTFTAVARGESISVDAAMIEVAAAPGVYFDGSTTNTSTTTNQWADPNKPHRTFSTQTLKAVNVAMPPAETPTAKTLIAIGGATANQYKVGLWYTFENEIGESAPSKILEVRTSRPWSNWIWETANAAGEPSGTSTDVAELCADQLVCSIPQAVYEQAVAEGATRWNLYAMSWSDQEVVPVQGTIIGGRDIYADTESALARTPALSWLDGGWFAITPARRLGTNTALLPTRLNRVNYSQPPKARTGLVAGDRIILLGDPDALATIRYSSNRPGEYTNFSASQDGGSKTLTSGNLNIPAAVVLWQNPQSVDTLTVLCMSFDGMSVSYYMMPAQAGAQSSSTSIMGFEETTSTPGTVCWHGNEVMNNALFRPTDKALLKSTAQNYNISHKTLSDNIENMWRDLRSKEWIMSAQLNNRLCYLVNNPLGANLEEGCRGNELWIYDVSGENGVWSRLLVQGLALRVLTVGGKDFLSVTRPEGLYYLDPDAREDAYVVMDDQSPDYRKVLQRPIPWKFETNTQGANRAHDAWAHLQQVQLTLGNFVGTMRYGIRGQDVNHRLIDAWKQFSDNHPLPEDGTLWDVDDILQVRRDMKEWYFHAESVDGVHSSGQIGYVQYRYTPVSVNVGYEFGSIETFEYGRNTESGPNGHSENGIPVPAIDFSRP